METMSYATIMVHVDAEGELDGRVGVAASLADRFSAHLIGIAGWAPKPLFVAEGVVIDPAPTEAQLQNMRASLERTGEMFRAAAATGGRRPEWRCSLDFPTDYVAREARAADLIVIGREWRPMDPYRSLDAGGLILKAGRPVLVAPKGITSLSARRILIAWKDVREARRAVQDALPFLQRADSILIVEIPEAGEEEQALRRVKDVSRFLANHRITTIGERVRAPEVRAIDTLLHVVQDERIDLIVAGAYGHSRLGEWIFGGVTRDLLTTSPVCCLLSH
jgi:nucleotide-binding universal stress UspA family protein